MSSFIAVLPSVPHYQMTANLDGDNYTFDFRWNTRDAAWYFDMYDADETLIIAGVKVLLCVPLGRRSAHPFFSTNILVAIDTTLENRDATLDDFGARILLKHMTYAEYAQEILNNG